MNSKDIISFSGYETEIHKIFHILLRKADRNDFYNPVIIHMNPMLRWQIVAEVARRMAIGEAPEALSNHQVIALDYEALFTDLPNDYSKHGLWGKLPFQGERSLTEIEMKEWLATSLSKAFWPPLEKWVAPNVILQRLQGIFLALFQSERPSLLFVDSLDRLLGGEWEQYPIHAAEVLKPVLARRQIQLIGACTLIQYQRYIAQSVAVQRRFQGVLIPDIANSHS